MTSPSQWTEADRRRVLAHLAETVNVEATLAAFPGLTPANLRAMLRGDAPPRTGPRAGSSPEVTAGTTVVAHVDGASRGNPGHAAIGAVLEDTTGHILRRISRYIGRTTNNVAEYTALIETLKAAALLGARSVIVYADSELVVRQMRGDYRVRAPHLRTFHDAARAAAAAFAACRIEHIPREENAEADALAQAALDNRRRSP